MTKKQLDAIALNLDALSDDDTQKLMETLTDKQLNYVLAKSVEFKLNQLDTDTLLDLASKI